jgi:hypothetical protein
MKKKREEWLCLFQITFLLLHTSQSTVAQKTGENIMNNLPTMWEVQQQYNHLVKQKQYAEAHKLITENVGIFDRHAQKIVYYWLFWTAVMLNEAELTI